METVAHLSQSFAESQRPACRRSASIAARALQSSEANATADGNEMRAARNYCASLSYLVRASNTVQSAARRRCRLVMFEEPSAALADSTGERDIAARGMRVESDGRHHQLEPGVIDDQRAPSAARCRALSSLGHRSGFESFFSDETRVVTIPAVNEIKSEGIWATRPPPMESRV